MSLTNAGGVLKYCVRCGKAMHLENWYAALPTKYCRECAAASKREQTALCMRNARKKAREQRALEREQNRLLKDENELLRQQVRALRYRVEALSTELMEMEDAYD